MKRMATPNGYHAMKAQQMVTKIKYGILGTMAIFFLMVVESVVDIGLKVVGM